MGRLEPPPAKTLLLMAKIIISRCANEVLRDHISWQVYHALANHPATMPHHFWYGNQHAMLNVEQPMFLTLQSTPCKFKSLMEMLRRNVGILCTRQEPQRILNGIDLLSRQGAEIIVVGMSLGRIRNLYQQRVFDALKDQGHEIVMLPPIIPNVNIENVLDREPNNALDDFTQLIMEAVMTAITEINNQNQ